MNRCLAEVREHHANLRLCHFSKITFLLYIQYYLALQLLNEQVLDDPGEVALGLPRTLELMPVLPQPELLQLDGLLLAHDLLLGELGRDGVEDGGEVLLLQVDEDEAGVEGLAEGQPSWKARHV